VVDPFRGAGEAIRRGSIHYWGAVAKGTTTLVGHFFGALA
jgi:hypothetical protein